MNIPLIDRSCPLCGTNSNSKLFAEANFDFSTLDAFAFASRKFPEYMHLRLMECRTCDTVYSSPVPSPDFLQNAYKDAAYDSPIEAGYASRTYSAVIKKALAHRPLPKSAVDIGTGEGSFLEEMQNWGIERVVGVEPSSAPIAAAKEFIRPLIVHDIFRDDLFPTDSFDLVTCFQTIEHLSDPLAFCKSARKILRPGQPLVIVGHNRRAMSAKLMGRKSPIFDIEHLQLFSPFSAKKLFELAGFDHVQVKPIFNRYPMHYWAKLFPFPKKLKPALLSTMIKMKFGNLPIPMPAGNLVAIGFKPN